MLLTNSLYLRAFLMPSLGLSQSHCRWVEADMNVKGAEDLGFLWEEAGSCAQER